MPFKKQTCGAAAGSPKVHCSAGAGERQQSMGEQPHTTSKKGNPCHGMTQTYISKGEAGGNVAGNIHQPWSQHK